jgi:hypothetical protein
MILGFRLYVPQIFARLSKLRNDVRNSSIQKVGAHYKLIKSPELSHSHIRAKVRALHADHKYIFPYNPAHPFDPPPPPAPAPLAPNGEVVNGEAMPATPVMRDRDDTKVFACLFSFRYHRTYNMQYFKLNSPFLAPAFADVIHDVWFSGPKANGFKPDYIKAMVSHDPNRPNERELPAPMICLVGADVRIVLLHGFGLISPTFRSMPPRSHIVRAPMSRHPSSARVAWKASISLTWQPSKRTAVTRPRMSKPMPEPSTKSCISFT